MKSSTLRTLTVSLVEVRHYYLASALLDDDAASQTWFRGQAAGVQTLLDAIDAELSARDTHVRRTLQDEDRADQHLKHLLADFLGFDGSVAPVRALAADPVAIRPLLTVRGSAQSGDIPPDGEAARDPIGTNDETRAQRRARPWGADL